jgi:hypothetical protein
MSVTVFMNGNKFHTSSYSMFVDNNPGCDISLNATSVLFQGRS